MKNIDVYLSSCIHVFLIASLEIVFYFMYIANQEKEAVIHEVKNMMTYDPKYQKMVETLSHTNEYQQIIKNLDEKSKIEQMEMEKKNGDVRRQAMYVVLILFSSVVVLYLLRLYGPEFMTREYCGTFYSHILELVITLTLIGVFEYILFTYIVSKYQTISTSELETIVLTSSTKISP